jgi:NAD(P)H-dependent flavin oxidoreductase YrpB (nitropropane dioxygenase family)
LVIAAGGFETGFAVLLKQSDGFKHLWPTVGFAICALLSFGLLTIALKQLPVGSAYAVWTGLGAAGTAAVGMIVYGDPDASLVELVHQGGALACWQVGSLDEARAAADLGCDLVVVQGNEAGGHVRGQVALLPLLDAVLSAVEVPIVAAGGITSARALAAMLASGASAARVGTRFVACAESPAHPDYVRALIDAGGGDTQLTETFSVTWPDAPHRVLRSCVDAATDLDSDVVGELHVGDQVTPLPRLLPLPPTRATTGHIEAMPLYAGQGVGLVAEVEPAADIVHALVDGAEALLRRT